MQQQLKEAGLDDQVSVSSAGTGTWHLGHQPDERTIRIAEANGITLESIAQHISEKPFSECDYILVMDDNNRQDVEAWDTERAHAHKIFLTRAFDPEATADPVVPDPYMGGESDFDGVYQVLNRSVSGFIQYLKAHEGLSSSR